MFPMLRHICDGGHVLPVKRYAESCAEAGCPGYTVNESFEALREAAWMLPIHSIIDERSSWFIQDELGYTIGEGYSLAAALRKAVEAEHAP